MYFDGSLKLGGAGAGVLFISLEGNMDAYQSSYGQQSSQQRLGLYQKQHGCLLR
jgi:hypothetical protein